MLSGLVVSENLLWDCILVEGASLVTVIFIGLLFILFYFILFFFKLVSSCSDTFFFFNLFF